MIKKTYQIEGMECGMCAMRLQELEDMLPGVQTVEASYRKGEMVVVFDENLVNDGAIADGVVRLGYQVVERK
ncbi:MAG TPA: cation transporter [Anaerolineaceae bacterium]|nr:cation transporter [Anaerolineaceae bacterium]HPN52335.1 cation transporter [Anaerolineaceae bacterium]